MKRLDKDIALPIAIKVTDTDLVYLGRGQCPTCGAALRETGYGWACSELFHGPHWGIETMSKALQIKVDALMSGYYVRRLIRSRLR